MAIKRVQADDTGDDNNYDNTNQQALLSLMSGGGNATTRTPSIVGNLPAAAGSGSVGNDTQATTPLPGNNSGITGGMDKSVSGPSGSGSPMTNPAWDTDGFAAPQFTAGNVGGVMSGWDATKWADPNNQHPKYVIGRILSGYAPTTDNAPKAAADIAKAYPGTTFNGKDKITVPGVGTIDFLKGAGNGGEAWQYGIEDGSPSSASGGGVIAPTISGVGSSNNAIAALTQGSTYQKLLQALQGISGPASTDQQALMSLMAPQQQQQ